MIIYESYGLPANENHPVYTFDEPATETYDTLEVYIPGGWDISKNAAGQTLVESPDGITYLGGEILSSWEDAPAFRWYDGCRNRRVMLEVLIRVTKRGVFI